jgi:NDP-sugar pyrophosphorylase family protein
LDNINTIVLSAGKGSRINEISGGMPKTLIDVNGKSTLERNLLWLNHYNIDDIWVNVHHNYSTMVRAINRINPNISISYEEKLKGTAGAVSHVRKFWKKKDYILVVYGDNIFNFDLHGMIKFHEEKQSSITVAIYDKHKNPNSGLSSGMIVDKGGEIIEFVESADDSVSTKVNAGVYIINDKVAKNISDRKMFDFGHNVFPEMIQNGTKILCYKIEGYCLCIDTPDSYKKTLRFLIKKEKK